MYRFAIAASLNLFSAFVSAAEPSTDPVATFYEQARPQIDPLVGRSLDSSLPMSDRVKAARELMSSYPNAAKDLWKEWLASAPDLAQLAVSDMQARLFSLHYGHAAHGDNDGTGTPVPVLARDTLRELMATDGRPAIRLAALNALCQAGDEAALQKLGEEVVAGRYQPSIALRHLSAKPQVGGAVLAELAANSQVPTTFRLDAVKAMKGSSAFNPFLRKITLNASASSTVRLEALEVLTTATGDTSDAAIFVLTEPDKETRQAAFKILADRVRASDGQPGQLELLLKLQQTNERQPRQLRLDSTTANSIDQMIKELRSARDDHDK